MANKSQIEWTDATWNPLRGCSRISPGCVNCYAERMAARGLPGLSSPATGEPFAIMTPSGPRWTGKVELIESKLLEPLRWRKPRIVFCNSMSDLFHERVPDEWIDRIFAVMALCPQHYFLVLTKRADRMQQYMTTEFMCNRVFKQMVTVTPDRGVWRWPGMREAFKHIGLGVSVEDQQRADERIPHLLETPAAVRFISAEPLLGPVDLTRWLRRATDSLGIPTQLDRRPDWVIVGGESGPGARPCYVKWVRDLKNQCVDSGVAAFVKQLGAEIHGDHTEFFTAEHIPMEGHRTWRLIDPKGGDPREWPEDLRVRQYPAQISKWSEEYA